MKKILFVFTIFLGIVAFAQNQKLDFKKMTSEQRKEAIKKMSPEKRRELLEKVGAEMLIRNLQIPQEKQTDFKDLFTEYMKSQKEIHEKFKPNFKQKELTDSEAQKKLKESFEVGQLLLNNKKLYADKFLKILSPQQVLQLFQAERKLHDKMKEHGKDDNYKMKKPD